MKKQKNSMMKKLALITGAAVLSSSMCIGSLNIANVTFAEEADTAVTEDQQTRR